MLLSLIPGPSVQYKGVKIQTVTVAPTLRQGKPTRPLVRLSRRTTPLWKSATRRPKGATNGAAYGHFYSPSISHSPDVCSKVSTLSLDYEATVPESVGPLYLEDTRTLRPKAGTSE